MKKMRTRLLSLLLVLVTVLSLLPTSALAASSTGTGIKPTSNTNYWTTRLLHDGTPYSYKPPMAAGKMLYCMDRGYGYRWGTPSFLNSYTYTSATGADADAADASVKCLSCTLMLTGGMLTAECVLELSAVPYTLTGMTIVSAAGEAEPVKRQRAIIVYFASANETRFDVAKRYSLPVSSIAAGGDTLCEGEKLTFLC